MNVAVLSDIHSNLPALEAVLEDARAKGATDHWCLGDTVGYGPEPEACVAAVRRLAAACLAGNHDLGVTGVISLEDFVPACAQANRWTSGVLSAEAQEWLKGLPSKTEASGVTLAHGSVRDPVWEYVVSGVSAKLSFDRMETSLCLVGHSHLPFVCWESLRGPPVLTPARDGEERLLEPGRFIVNPGSVGQPRDGDPRASYAIIDLEEKVVRHYRVAYDIAATQAKMRAAKLPTYLIERLPHGR
ncbi:MAG: metallophosphoesterase family protein [Chloroflexi bacterium]|nr:metallophosphoesterase family protein [Chloroflexota bacterium]